MLGLVPTSIANIPIVVKVALPAGPMSELVRRDPLGVVWELPVGGRWRSMIGIRSTGLTNGDPRTRSLPLAFSSSASWLELPADRLLRARQQVDPRPAALSRRR